MYNTMNSSNRRLLTVATLLLISSITLTAQQTDRDGNPSPRKQAIAAQQLAIIQQVGERNSIDIQQMHGERNIAQVIQEGVLNQGAITLLEGVENVVKLIQNGQVNQGEITLTGGRENTIHAQQQRNNNILDLNLGSATSVQWRISQEGNGFIQIDIPDYQRFSGPDLRRLEIRQENGGVPIIIRPGSSLNLPLPGRTNGPSN